MLEIIKYNHYACILRLYSFNKWLIEMYKLYVYQSTKLEVSLGLI